MTMTMMNVLKLQSTDHKSDAATPKYSGRFSSLVSALALSLSLSFPALTYAQGFPTVTLESPNGKVSITGELREVDEQYYTIMGALGLMKIVRAAVECSGEGCPVVEETAADAPASRAVVLSAVDDETQIRGELVDMTATHYIIQTTLGEFRVAISNVECAGAACPDIDVYDPKLAIHGGNPEVIMMVSDLLRGYAAETGLAVETDETDGAVTAVRLLSKEDQSLVADVSLVVDAPLDAAGALSNRSADILVYEQAQIGASLAATPNLDVILQNVLAFDGQVVVAHDDNPVRNLSEAEIGRIWNGSLTSWSPLGAGDFPIAIHMLEDAGGETEWLAGLRVSTSPNVITHATEAAVIDAVNADRNALGLVHRKSAKAARAKMLSLRSSCGLTTDPSGFDLSTQQYPFTTPVYTYTRGTGLHSFAQSFLQWTKSAEAAAADMSKWGYIGTQLQRMKIQDMGTAVVHSAAFEPDFSGAEFASMMKELRTADRLSITFRFLPGSAELDQASVLSIKDLARRLQGREFDGQEVLLVGFTDNTGPAERNTFLSGLRAESVNELLAQELDASTRERLNLTQMGFGEQMPLDCNDTDEGRASNRRVEVWTRVPS